MLSNTLFKLSDTEDLICHTTKTLSKAKFKHIKTTHIVNL